MHASGSGGSRRLSSHLTDCVVALSPVLGIRHDQRVPSKRGVTLSPVQGVSPSPAVTNASYRLRRRRHYIAALTRATNNCCQLGELFFTLSALDIQQQNHGQTLQISNTAVFFNSEA